MGNGLLVLNPAENVQVLCNKSFTFLRSVPLSIFPQQNKQEQFISTQNRQKELWGTFNENRSKENGSRGLLEQESGGGVIEKKRKFRSVPYFQVFFFSAPQL